MFSVPVYFMASMARSGETLMLRTASAHPRIHVIHNLEKQDTSAAVELYQLVQHYESGELGSDHPLLAHLNVQQGDVLLVKQSTYERKLPFRGFILVRNPLAVCHSLLSYDGWGFDASRISYLVQGVREGVFKKHITTRGRLIRWMRDIDAELAETFSDLSALDMFCVFYNRRMLKLLEQNVPVIHYENFVEQPETVVRQMLAALGLDFDPAVLASEKGFHPGEVGHGKNDLSRPIDTSSLHKYQKLGRPVMRRIVSLTQPTWSAYGYTWQADECLLLPPALETQASHA